MVDPRRRDSVIGEPGPLASTSSKQTAPLPLQPGRGTTSTDVPTTQNDVHTLAPLAGQSGQGVPSSDVPTLAPLARQSGQGVPSSDVPSPMPNPMSTSTRLAQDSAVGVQPRVEGVPRGRSPLPFDRRTVTLGRSRTPATLNTSTVTSAHHDRAPVPAGGHALPTTGRSAAEARPPPQMTLPPPLRG